MFSEQIMSGKFEAYTATEKKQVIFSCQTIDIHGNWSNTQFYLSDS